MSMNKKNKNQKKLNVDGEDLEEVEEFVYIGSVINNKGGTEQDVRTRIKKAQIAFGILNKVWRTNNISNRIKIRIFNSNIKSVLLYGAESWKTNKNMIQKLQSFTNKCLRKILNIY